MIKITHPELEKLASAHYQFVEGKIANALKINKIDEQNKRIKKIFGDAYDFKQIILASPEEMETLVTTWLSASDEDKDEFSYYITTLYNEFSTVKIQLEGETEPRSRALRLVDDLGLIACPYCNRNFINNTDKKGRRTCDIDHFFAKTNFPFLAISFYNLIPSCKWCNFVKLDSANSSPEEFILNPYDTREGYTFDAKIEVKIENCEFYYKTSALKVEFSNILNKRVQNHIKAFHLDKLYAQHTDFVLELIQKKYAYSKSYLDSLYKQYEGTLFKNREDILRLVAGNFVDEANLSKRPLSKLTKDIVQQLDL